MASEVDIANLALAHLGDVANVSSLSPPEGSPQAEHCARFYPIARDALLEMHAWGFSTKRVSLALLSGGWPEWEYVYAAPVDALNLLAVLPPDATDDNVIRTAQPDTYGYAPAYASAAAYYAPQEFVAEAMPDGTQVIYTDQQNAVLRYTARVTDSIKFSPLFTMALSWHLAGLLAGPLIKGETGRKEGARCMQMAEAYVSKARESDANQQRLTVTPVTPWMARR